MVESRLFDLETGKPVGKLDLPAEGRCIRTNRGSLKDLLSDGLSIEYEKKFERFEHVQDKSGREAIRAVFDDGSEVYGSAIIGGDGVHSTGT